MKLFPTLAKSNPGKMAASFSSKAEIKRQRSEIRKVRRSYLGAKRAYSYWGGTLGRGFSLYRPPGMRTDCKRLGLAFPRAIKVSIGTPNECTIVLLLVEIASVNFGSARRLPCGYARLVNSMSHPASTCIDPSKQTRMTYSTY